MRVARFGKEEINAELIEKAESLWAAVWPPSDPISEDRMERRLKRFKSIHSSYRLHMLWINGQVVAQCSSFHREIEFLNSKKRLVQLGLAGVCSSPSHRGNGYGAAVVKDAFARLGEEKLPFSLYQTEVPQFYEKLGAKKVENRFVNSKSEEDSDANPWWNDFVMTYPAQAAWEEGSVDLLGPGY